MNDIKRYKEILRLQEAVNDLTERIAVLKKECPHNSYSFTDHCDSGYSEKVRYWKVYTCEVCGYQWTVDK